MITAARNVATRLVRTSQPWDPWNYQLRGVSHLLERHAAALFLDPGLGKTAIVLEAFRRLLNARMVQRMLVVAPLRVCQLVWRQEGQKWEQFRDLTFSLLHGPKKEERLKDDVHIHLINPEGIPWLSNAFYGRSDLPWDVVTIDELPKFKNHRAIRSKRLRSKLGNVRYRWGLTGSPAPNGYMDLFGQMLMLDDGAALGKYITHFRDKYFQQDYNGFSYVLRDGAAERIEAKIAPYVLRMSAEDYLELPPLTDNKIIVELPKAVREKYEELKKEMILSLPEGTVTAANAAATYTKLKQITNGAVYYNTDHDFAEIHDAKLEALEELIEELAGQPLLVAYEFQSDLARIRARLGEDTPTLTGQSERQITELEARWNRGELPVLLVHPASAGHGLNLQGSGASHICWISRPWDLSLYDQTIRRIYRQGSTAERVVNHILHIPNTMDDVVDEALRDKDVTQRRLLDALNAEVISNGKGNMGLKKLGYQGEQSSAAPTATSGTGTVQPRGWGTAAPAPSAPAPATDKPTPRGWGNAAAAADPQRETIQNKLRAPAPAPEQDEDEQPPASVRALAAFPPDVVQQLTGEGGEGEDAPAADPYAGVQEARAAAPTPRGWTKIDTWVQTDAPDPAAEPEKADPEKPADAKNTSRRGRRTATEAAKPAETPAQAPKGLTEAAQQAELPGTSTWNAGVRYTGPVGAPTPETLATLFESIARLLRGQ